MPNYANLALTAQRLIGSFGKTVKIVKAVRGTYDPVLNTIIEHPEEYIIKGVRLEYSSGMSNGADIKTGDIRLVVEAVDLPSTPTIEDEIILDNIKWKIVPEIIEIKPGDTVVYYELHLRK